MLLLLFGYFAVSFVRCQMLKNRKPNLHVITMVVVRRWENVTNNGKNPPMMKKNNQKKKKNNGETGN